MTKPKLTKEEQLKLRVAFNKLFKIKKGIIVDVRLKCPITGFPANKFQNIVQP